jgi:hypothetical protein
MLLAGPLGLPNDYLVLTFSFPRKFLLFTGCTALFVWPLGFPGMVLRLAFAFPFAFS